MRLHTCWQRPPDALYLGWTESGELEVLHWGWWDGSDGFTCSEDW